MENIAQIILCVIVIIALYTILKFLFFREINCWYLKINARLEEQKKTNELLQNIFDALIQGNTVNALTAGQVIKLNDNQNVQSSSSNVVNQKDIPDL